MTFNEKISINGIGGHINTNPKKSYKTKAVKSLFTGKTYRTPNTKIMTPKQIIINFIQSRLDANDDMEMLEAKENAIEAMKQWGKGLCDKQKHIVLKQADKDLPLSTSIEVFKDIKNAPYPKELL